MLGKRRYERGRKMKKVINGKLYDTSTAELVGEWNNGRLDDRLFACSEDLYQKRTGEYFLFGSVLTRF